MIRASLELMLATLRYRVSIAPEVRNALARWKQRAEAIGEARLREIALGKLQNEGLNAEGAGMLAVLAARRHRHSAVEAMVALQVLYDYLDGVSESEPDADGRLYRPLVDALTVGGVERRADDRADLDGGYARELAATVSAALARLPAAERAGGVLAAGAERCAEAQPRVHAIPHAGIEQARAWAQQRGDGAPGWQETLAAGAASVVGLHALLAAAADERTTTAQTEAIDALYRSICAVTTLLDSAVDRESDLSAREPGFTSLYESQAALADGLARAARQAVQDTAKVPHGTFHLTMLAGIIGYYASAEGAQSEYARPVIAEARAALGPLVALTTAVWRAWRGSHNYRHTR